MQTRPRGAFFFALWHTRFHLPGTVECVSASVELQYLVAFRPDSNSPQENPGIDALLCLTEDEIVKYTVSRILAPDETRMIPKTVGQQKLPDCIQILPAPETPDNGEL